MNAVSIKLDSNDWNQLIAILREVAMPWRVTNPLLVQIVTQLEEHHKSHGDGQLVGMDDKRAEIH